MQSARRLLMLVAVALLSSAVATTVLAQTTKVEVEIGSVDTTTRTVTVIYNGKEIDLDLSRMAKITIAGEAAEASSILPGDKATVEYHKDLAVITRIDAQGLGADGWRFYDIFNRGVDPDRAIVVSQDGTLVCQGNVGGFCLASLREFSEFTFTVDFQFTTEDFKGGPWIGVACTPPNPKASEWTQQIPKGIEVKIGPANIGELVLPTADFNLELPLGQLRDERKVVALRKPELNMSDWNTLEITCDQHRNVTVKVNETTVNAIAKAEDTTGHVILSPQGVAMRFRKPMIVSGEKETPLSFENVMVK